MKIMLLAGLYLFFIRVLWSVFSELRDPRTVARKRNKAAAGGAAPAKGTVGVAGPIQAVPANAAAAAQPIAHGAATATATAARGQLYVIEPAELAGATYDLGSEITLGRAHTNGIILDDTYVSTVHARIFFTGDTYFVEDLASRNGSTLNDGAIVATTALVPGDRLQLGATMMEFS